jgi:hypothetical protein
MTKSGIVHFCLKVWKVQASKINSVTANKGAAKQPLPFIDEVFYAC